MKKRTIIDYLGITAGSFLIALALTVFLVPNKIAAGGVSGLATVIYYITSFPIGITMLIINIPLFLAGLKIMGSSFGMRTIYGIITLSVFTDLLQPHTTALTDDLLLASIYGGVVGGIGLGIVFRSRGTTGGTDMIASLINYFTGITVGEGLLIADGVVVALAGIFFNLEVALYAAVTIFITSQTIDVVQEGLNFKKGVLIISDQADQISQMVVNDLNRGITEFEAKGGYTGDRKQVLLCIISRSEVSELKKEVSKIDRDAFVIISDVHEVLGEGFTEIAH
ncbi:MAG: YitT family protein [Halanaerobiales bacterium]|nr:YitT family protein [Halanaerobiales bacterium]